MWNWICKVEEIRKQGVPFAIVTVTQVTGSTPRETGAKMIVLENGLFHGTIGGGKLESLALDDARKIISKGHSEVIRYPLGAKAGQCCGGIAEVLFEPVHSGPQLYLFGAGHVGQAVCKTLVGTPFTVHLIDDRPDWIESQNLPSETIRYSMDWSEFLPQADWNADKTYCAIMTHRHDLDQEILHSILDKPFKYLGLIGSEAKWKRFRQRLGLKGVSEELFKRVESPIGLPLGGKSPQEVAISLSSRLLQLHYHGTAS